MLALGACTTQKLARIDNDAGACNIAAAPAVGDLPCDVAAVLQARCQPCHQMPPLHHAPFPELSYEDLMMPYGIAGLVRWQRMAEVIEPGNSPHMPPRDAPQLSDSDFATLRGWFGACAQPLPEGTGCDVSADGGTD
jgi:uncharacterized membrane protein